MKFVTFVNVPATPDVFFVPSYFRTSDLISEALKLLWCELCNVHVHSNICQGLACTLVALPFALQISGKAAQGLSVYLGNSAVTRRVVGVFFAIYLRHHCCHRLIGVFSFEHDLLQEARTTHGLHMILACLSYNHTSHSHHCILYIIWIGVQSHRFVFYSNYDVFFGVGL